jgi:hypothetical protein
VIRWHNIATDAAHQQTVADGAVTDDRFAFKNFRDHLRIVIGEENADTFADRPGISADGDEKALSCHTNPDVARETQNAFHACLK